LTGFEPVAGFVASFVAVAGFVTVVSFVTVADYVTVVSFVTVADYVTVVSFVTVADYVAGFVTVAGFMVGFVAVAGFVTVADCVPVAGFMAGFVAGVNVHPMKHFTPSMSSFFVSFLCCIVTDNLSAVACWGMSLASPAAGRHG